MDPTGVALGEALVLEAADARLVVRPEEGGRIGSVVVGGRELLVTSDPQGLIHWGCYPMAPWAGRIRHGEFSFAGRHHALPLGLPPHAIHGVVYDRQWSITGPDSIAVDLDERWPFRGRVEQRFSLDEDGLGVTMRLEADEPMPGVVGWHPWFRRSLDGVAESAALEFDAADMLVRDAEGMPTGERVPPSEGPWDDAFTGVRRPPVIEWGTALRLELASSCSWWVVYTEPRHAVCVEPQSGPPDAANMAPEVVSPGSPLVHEMRWRWTRG
jgi:aldose 1-epimerase